MIYKNNKQEGEGSMFMEERQKDIVRRVNEEGRIMVSEIQSLYQVSADCARRDLRVLESRGLLDTTDFEKVDMDGLLQDIKRLL